MNEKEIAERILKMCTNTSLVFPINTRDTKDTQWKVYNNKNKEDVMEKKCTRKKALHGEVSMPHYVRMYEDAEHRFEELRRNSDNKIKELQDEILKLENKIMELNKELDRISRARIMEQHNLITQNTYESVRTKSTISKLKNIINHIIETL